MLNALNGTWIWVWQGDDLWRDPLALEDFAAQVAAIPGEKGVLLKAADGNRNWNPAISSWGAWDARFVEFFRRRGIKVGLWTYNYGAADTSVVEEVAALERALAIATPDLVILNAELEILSTSDPATQIYDLVRRARNVIPGEIPLGLSSVWRWAYSQRWPFLAAFRGGVDFWANQVYPENWEGEADWSDDQVPWIDEAFDFAHSLGGGLPELPALWCAAPSTAESMAHYAQQAIDRGAVGISWWRVDTNTVDWNGIRAAALLLGGASEADPSTMSNGHLVRGGFYHQYHSVPDPVAIFGLALTDEIPLPGEDLVERTSQVFERAIFEYHPDAAAGHTVQLRRLGAQIYGLLDALSITVAGAPSGPVVPRPGKPADGPSAGPGPRSETVAGPSATAAVAPRPAAPPAAKKKKPARTDTRTPAPVR